MFDYKEWSKTFLSCTQVPMTDELSKTLMNMMMAELNRSPAPEQVMNAFSVKIAMSRAEFLGFKTINWQAATFLSVLTKGNPGTLVMYLSALRSRTTEFTTGALANNFPMGFLSEQELETMWDLQKDDNGKNGLDFISAEFFKA